MTTAETVVDGVQAVHAPRGDGRMAAGLVFRVGRADETLATSGITHLVEHLALHDHGLGDLHYNGATADVLTHFHVEGTAAHVVEYLHGVCAALNDLPVHRLATEKEILRTEAGGRGGGPAPHSALYRYGAQGYGLSTFHELGLHRVDADAVRAWTAKHFTRENAVLWVMGDGVPDGLELHLPNVHRSPPPEPTPALPDTPAWYFGPGELVHMSGVVARSTAAAVFATVLSRALFLDLRQNSGLSYRADAAYHPRDRDHALVELVADGLPATREAVLGGVVDTLARLRLGTITQAELESARSAVLRELDVPDWEAQSLPAYAVNALLGHRNLGRDQLRAELLAVSVDDVQAVAREFHASALAQVPALGLDWAGFTRAPEGSAERVSGKEFPSREKDGSRLLIGPEGVSFVAGDHLATVHYADTVAMQAFPDGGRLLYGRDGLRIAVEPTINAVDESTIAEIDRAVPADAVIRMPARPPDAVPQPQPASPQKAKRGPRPLLLRALAAVVGVVGLFFVLVAVQLTVPVVRGEPAGDVGGAIAGWLLVGLFGWLTWLFWRLSRR